MFSTIHFAQPLDVSGRHHSDEFQTLAGTFTARRTHEPAHHRGQLPDEARIRIPSTGVTPTKLLEMPQPATLNPTGFAPSRETAWNSPEFRHGRRIECPYLNYFFDNVLFLLLRSNILSSGGTTFFTGAGANIYRCDLVTRAQSTLQVCCFLANFAPTMTRKKHQDSHFERKRAVEWTVRPQSLVVTNRIEFLA